MRRRSLLIWSTGVALFAVGLFYAAGGWYFSGQIWSGALQVRQSESDRSLEVVRTTRDTITLVETGEDVSELDEAMTYGLAWDGGYGEVFGRARVDQQKGTSWVTRRFVMLTGDRPRVGDRAGLERDAFPADDPAAAVSEPVTTISYTSSGGTFPAWFLPGAGSSWVIFTHGGLGSGRAEALRAMQVTARLRMPSLAIGYRNDEGAPADPSGYYSYGRTEWHELAGAVRYAVDHGASDVTLVGYSMGGAITASFLKHSALASYVSRVVLDAPMLDLGSVVVYGAEQRTLPLIGSVPTSLTWTARQIAAMRYDVDWNEVDYLHQSEWVDVPTLVFHGDLDPKVPLSTSRALRAGHPHLVKLVTVHGAGHVEAWNVDPTAYDRALREFLAKR